MRVELFVPDLVDQFQPSIVFKMMNVLEEIGCKVDYNEEQTGVGELAFNEGFYEDTKEIAEKFLKSFSGDYQIVSPSASIVQYIRNYHDQLFQNSTLHIKHKKIQEKIVDICELLVDQLEITKLNKSFDGSVYIHNSCSIYQEEGSRKNYMEVLLKNVKGVTIVNEGQSQSSCGIHEDLQMGEKEIGDSLGNQLIEEASTLGANYIVVEDVECYLQIKRLLTSSANSLQVIHILDIIG